MNNKEFGKQLELLTRLFAIEVIRLSVSLPNTTEAKVIRNQLTKAGTSIGANYREANRARSKADFKNKIEISERESSETCYWLEIIESMNWSEPSRLSGDLLEVKELLGIFTRIGRSLKSLKSA